MVNMKAAMQILKKFCTGNYTLFSIILTVHIVDIITIDTIKIRRLLKVINDVRING